VLALLFGVKFQRVARAGGGGIASGRGALQVKQRKERRGGTAREGCRLISKHFSCNKKSRCTAVLVRAPSQQQGEVVACHTSCASLRCRTARLAAARSASLITNYKEIEHLLNSSTKHADGARTES
jgi:hypothetical protein